jgi:V8-like Glu-specific endopeptidase
VNYPSQFGTHYKTGNYSAAWPYDYAVITLDRPFPASVGYWKAIRVESARRLPKLRLNTAGYPGDKGGQHMYWAYDRVVSVRDRRLEYLMDTAGGQSGSPVWLKYGTKRYLIAVHTARDDVATPTIANRGVRITRPVLADIRRWVRS